MTTHFCLLLELINFDLKVSTHLVLVSVLYCSKIFIKFQKNSSSPTDVFTRQDLNSGKIEGNLFSALILWI